MIKDLGSFTGIRIGVATTKAFHDSLGIPCVGVNSLEALAYSIKQDGLIISILDCKNDNCYFAIYEHKNSEFIEILAPTANTIADTLATCHQYIENKATPIIFVGDGSSIYHELILREFNSYTLLFSENNLLDSYCVGLSGFDKFRKNKLEDVLPLYLKKPQAQRQLEEKSKITKITAMTQQDLKQISDILISDFDGFWNYAILKDELNAKNSSYLVAKLNGKIVGFAGMKNMIDTADIMNIVVRKDFRNQGIGSLLLEELIHLIKEQNLSSISLEVMEENYPAIHLYKNFGFEPIGIRKNYYQNKNGLIMQKRVL